MRKILSILLIAVLSAGMLIMTSCGKSEFACTDSTEKKMVFHAVNADKGDVTMSGSLEVDVLDTLQIGSDLDKGAVDLDFISTEGNVVIEEFPDTDVEADLTVHVSGSDPQTLLIPEGEYMVRATVAEKASGDITLKVNSPEDASDSEAEPISDMEVD